jgi:F-type H+-transporting ATPase subunit delta
VDISSLSVLFTSLPGRYARALFNEGKKANNLQEILDSFDRLDTFFEKHSSVRKLLTSSCVNATDLDAGWRALGDHLSFCPTFTAFMRQVIHNRRFQIIGKIKYVFRVAVAKHKNMRNVIVSSAVELLPEQRARVEKLIASAFKEKVIIRYKINERILAGIKIASEEVVVDASALSQLKQLSTYCRSLGTDDSTRGE